MTDRVIFKITFFWTMSWWLVFLFSTIYGVIFKLEKPFWSIFWHVKIWMWVVIGIVITVWFVAGGFRDLISLFRDLHRSKYTDEDDGFVKKDN